MDLSIIAPWVPIIASALISAVALIWNNRNTTKVQQEQAAYDAEDKVVTHWQNLANKYIELAEQTNDRVSALEDKNKTMEEQNNRHEAEIRRITSIVDLSIKHNKAWWDWYDAGANPPPPQRPDDLIAVVESLTNLTKG